MGYLVPHYAMPRRNHNADRGGRPHKKRQGQGWMKGRKKGKTGDRAPLTGGSMHSKTRIR